MYCSNYSQLEKVEIFICVNKIMSKASCRSSFRLALAPVRVIVWDQKAAPLSLEQWRNAGEKPWRDLWRNDLSGVTESLNTIISRKTTKHSILLAVPCENRQNRQGHCWCRCGYWACIKVLLMDHGWVEFFTTSN